MNKLKKASPSGGLFQADFKPAFAKRKVRFADKDTVMKANASVVTEFKGAFAALAK